MLEYQDQQRLLTVDMTCPNEAHKTKKRAEKSTKVPTIVLQITRKTSRIYGESCSCTDWVSRRWNKTTRRRY